MTARYPGRSPHPSSSIPRHAWVIIISAIIFTYGGLIYYSYRDGTKADFQGAALERAIEGGAP